MQRNLVDLSSNFEGPKCTIDGHGKTTSTIICLNKLCTKENCLLCSKCLLKKEHENCNVVNLDEFL